jgi:hypothetical protein
MPMTPLTPPRQIHFAPTVPQHLGNWPPAELAALMVPQPRGKGPPPELTAPTVSEAEQLPSHQAVKTARTPGLKHSGVAESAPIVKPDPEPAEQDARRPQPATEGGREKATAMNADRTSLPGAPISQPTSKTAPPILVPSSPERRRFAGTPGAAEKSADARKTGGGGIRIGTVEVRVTSPEAAAAPALQPRPAPVSGATLSQGFRSFGLTQS